MIVIKQISDENMDKYLRLLKYMKKNFHLLQVLQKMKMASILFQQRSMKLT